MTVFDCLKPLTLSAVGNDDRMMRNKFVVVCKCPGVGTLLTFKCPAPRTHRETNARGLPGGGMLAVGIDSHIICSLIEGPEDLVGAVLMVCSYHIKLRKKLFLQNDCFVLLVVC